MSVFDSTAVQTFITDITNRPGINPRWLYIFQQLQTLLTSGGSIAADAVDTAQIADDAVEADQIADGVITSEKMATDSEAITDNTDVDPDLLFTAVTTTQACVGALGDAARTGQQKIIKCVAYAVGSYVLTPTNFADGTTITFDTLDDTVILVFDGSTWRLAYNSGATVA